ncbi:hypothetical protein GCM10009126_21120 [Rhodanobacter caeni]|uniref:Uncharacterized protein n=1 Tax=Rhodanobacter caeni TaxID=657654 RepID=A0ABN0UMQ5_9GAMM
MNIALNTSRPITVHTASEMLFKWYGTGDQVLAPRVRFNCQECGLAWAAPPNNASAPMVSVVNARLMP